MINHFFQDASPYNLSKDYQTNSLNSILQVVADDSARVSYAMIEDIYERAKKLNLGKSSRVQRITCSDITAGGSVYPCFDAQTYPDNQTGREGSITSGVLRSDADSKSTGYNFERTPSSVIAVNRPPCREVNSNLDPTSSEAQPRSLKIDNQKGGRLNSPTTHRLPVGE